MRRIGLPGTVGRCLRLTLIVLAVNSNFWCGRVSRGQSANPSGDGISDSAAPASSILPSEVAELEIALGRMRLVHDRFRIIRKHEQFADGSPDRQSPSIQRSLQVSISDGRPQLRFNYRDQHERWIVLVDNIVGVEWSRQVERDGQSLQVQYWQRPRAPIVIAVTPSNAETRKLSADTLWHFTQQSPPDFVQHVLPALRRLNPAWDLPALLSAAHTARQRCRATESQQSPVELTEWMLALDAEDHHARHAAERRLAESGLSVQLPLEQLARGRLSIQQRSIVEQVLGNLQPRTADTPTRLAYWMAGDQSTFGN